MTDVISEAPNTPREELPKVALSGHLHMKEIVPLTPTRNKQTGEIVNRSMTVLQVAAPDHPEGVVRITDFGSIGALMEEGQPIKVVFTEQLSDDKHPRLHRNLVAATQPAPTQR